MKYSDALELLPNATYIYSDVSDDVLNNLAIAHYVSELDGVKILGTNEPVEGLTELVAGSMSFG